MSNYVKATNFAIKDTLPNGDPNKAVKGTEINSEFTAIASAVSSKADINSPTFTGVPAAPTATSGSNTTQIANTAYVKTAVDALGNMSTQNKNAVDITGGTITGITDLAVADGGTGQSSYSAGQLLIGNSSGGLTKATLTAGSNVTITNGDGAITIAAASGSGGSVTSVATGNGLSGGTITSTGTLVIAAPTAGSVGSYTLARVTGVIGGTTYTYGSNYAIVDTWDIVDDTTITVRNNALTGTWKWLGPTVTLGNNQSNMALAVRVA